jgi:hypothetical protein
MFLLCAAPLRSVPVTAEWDRPDGWSEGTIVLIYERLAADATRLVATSETAITTVPAEFGPGRHLIFAVARDEYGNESEPTEPVAFKIITLRHQASSNMKDWTDTAVTHELEQTARQYRTLIEIP